MGGSVQQISQMLQRFLSTTIGHAILSVLISLIVALVLITVLLVTSSVLFAQSLNQPLPGQSSTPIKDQLQNKPAPSVVGSISIKSGSDLRVASQRTASSTMLGDIAARLNDTFSAVAALKVNKDFQNKEQLSMSNIKIGIAHRDLEIAKDLKYSTLVSSRIPTNEDARVKDRYYTGLGLEPKLAYTLNPVDVFYKLNLVRSFHEYTMNADGIPNTEYSISQLGHLGLTINRTSLSVEGELIRSITYRGISSDKFDLSEELGYQLSDQWAMAIGHSNSADMLKADGHESNLAFFNEQTSTIYGSLTYGF